MLAARESQHCNAETHHDFAVAVVVHNVTTYLLADGNKKEFQNGHIGLFTFFNFLYSQTEKKRETERERERKRNREMSRIPSIRSLQSLFLLCLISLQFISGLSLSLSLSVLLLFQCLNFTILFKHIYFLFAL